MRAGEVPAVEGKGWDMSTREAERYMGMSVVMVAFLVQVCSFLALSGAGDRFAGLAALLTPDPPATPAGAVAADPVPGGPVVVPQGDGMPVITDGINSPGEWGDALRVPMSGTTAVYLKHYRGVVFVGVFGEGGVGPSDLSLAVPGGRIQRLHVSAQLAETELTAAGAEPAPRFGLTTQWYANELRRDMAEAARLEREGRSPIEIIQATSYPSDGLEFAIRRTKFAGDVWLMRLWASTLIDGRPGMLTFPPGTAERSTAGWLELRFK